MPRAETLTVAETGSTNDDLAALARDGAPEGTWLRAGTQTGGKGRQGRAWLSPPGNFYASTIVRLRAGDPPAPTLALVAAVALHEVVARLISPPAIAGGAGGGPSFLENSSLRSHPPLDPLPEVREGRLCIKWPNDLLVGRAKLAGILLEREGDAVIAGFGVNLAHHPQGLAQETTSLAALGGELPLPGAFLASLARAFAARLAEWRSKGLAPIRVAWLAAAHPLGARLVTSEGPGAFDGLDESGALRLRLADGALRVIHAGDVFLI